MQLAIIFILFTGAIIWLGRRVYLSFQSKDGCASGCASCSTADIEKMKQRIAATTPTP